MIKKQVNVFDFYLVKDEDKEYYEQFCDFDNLELYHNKVVNDKGIIKLKGYPDVTPKLGHCTFTNKFELDKDEKDTLQMFNSTVKQAKDLYDSAKRKKDRYVGMLLRKACKELEVDSNEVFFGDDWNCNFSPLGHCIYKYDCGEPTCIFCGEPEERK